MQQGLGFRVLQLEEICSNAGKLKMHGRWRLTGSHVKANEKVIRLQYATTWNKTISCKSKYKKQKNQIHFVTQFWYTGFTLIWLSGEKKCQKGKAGLVKEELQKQCCYEWEMLCMKEMKERERESRQKTERFWHQPKSWTADCRHSEMTATHHSNVVVNLRSITAILSWL